MTWKPTPDERRAQARLLDGTVVEYRDLHIGDVFQAVTPDGEPFHPIDCEFDDETFARVVAEPIPNDMLDEGWAVAIDFGPRAEMVKALS